jgi:hypothetical protein
MKYKAKCRRCKKPTMFEYSYDYDDGGQYKDKNSEYCAKCIAKKETEWEKKQLKEALKFQVFVKGIKALSSKEEFEKAYSTLHRMGIEINPEDKNEKCRWCGGNRVFRYIMDDWEYMPETLCVDCMGKIVEAVKKVI